MISRVFPYNGASDDGNKGFAKGGCAIETTLYSWDKLATISGATAATLMIVQFIKGPLDMIVKIPTRWLAWVIAFLLLIAAHAMTTGITWSDLPLIIVNAFVVALATMGAYEATFATGDRQKKAEAVMASKKITKKI